MSAPLTPAPSRAVGAEHLADVAQPGRAQQRVAQRMGGDVTVGVAGAAVGVVEQQAQQPARPPGLDGMYVGAETDPRQH